MSQCKWSIRWTFGTDAQCMLEHHIGTRVINEMPDGRFSVDYTGTGPEHKAVLRDYAYPGSRTEVSWQAGDRREYTGPPPGSCGRLNGCVLPGGHHGKCAP